MDYLNISSTVDSTSAFRVEGAAKLLTCHLVQFLFFNLVREIAIEITGYKNFRTLYIYFCLCICFYLLSEKISTVVFRIRDKNMFSAV
jgi:hypothetical protein